MMLSNQVVFLEVLSSLILGNGSMIFLADKEMEGSMVVVAVRKVGSHVEQKVE